jgi:hypothetical protein
MSAAAAPTPATLADCFHMPIVGGHLGPKWPAGGEHIWQRGSQGAPERPVLLQDAAGELHMRLFEPRGSDGWAGVSLDAAMPTLCPELDGVRIVARLQWVDLDAVPIHLHQKAGEPHEREPTP